MGRDRIILDFWFGDLSNEEEKKKNMKKWFMKDKAFDQFLFNKFGKDIENAASGKYENWLSRPRGALALIILFDQFSRNVYRGTHMMFEYDGDALGIAKMLINTGNDKKLHPTERTFVYMPLMHSENLEDQELCIKLFEDMDKEEEGDFSGNVKYAIMHRDIVKRFGRFPHRNTVLMRESTPEEIEFLKEPGSSF